MKRKIKRRELYCFGCAKPMDKMTAKFVKDQISKHGNINLNCENCGHYLYFDARDVEWEINK